MIHNLRFLKPRFSWLTGGILLVFIIPILLCEFGFDKMYAKLEEVDISTARIRYTHYLFYIPIYNCIEETAPFLALPSNFREKSADWKPVNLFVGLDKVSPHYRFHGAVNQLEQITLAWQLSNFSPEQKQQQIITLLSLWQNGNDYHSASSFVQEIVSSSADP